MSVTAARPIVEQIAVALYTRLQLLTAGYAPTSAIKEVIRPTRMGGYTPKHLQIVITQSDPEEVEDLFVPGNPPAICFDQQFNIRCHIMPSEKDPTPIDEYISTITADVVRVVTDAGTDWFSFGQRAIDAKWEPREMIDLDGSFGGINVPLTVRYRTDENNPYSMRA